MSLLLKFKSRYSVKLYRKSGTVLEISASYAEISNLHPALRNADSFIRSLSFEEAAQVASEIPQLFEVAQATSIEKTPEKWFLTISRIV